MLTPEFRQKFFENTDHTGRHKYTSLRTGKEYFIECIDAGIRRKFGDINPATGELEGSYGQKYRGCIDKEDSMISEENGFKNVKVLEPGYSPYAYIEQLDAQYPDKV